LNEQATSAGTAPARAPEALPAFAPRVLFVPVSGPYGMGEYARSLGMARAVAARWPAAHIHFLLSRAAPYAAGTPFPHTLLPSSPTFQTAAVSAALASFRPDLVVFDNAGRTAQLRAARRAGARIVYVSARGRQRAKAFRLAWMRLIDAHWIAYPEFLAGSLGRLERMKLRLLARPAVLYLDVLLAPADAALRAALMARLGLTSGGYVLVVPGGGTGHPGAADAALRFWSAARGLAAAGTPTVFVGPVPLHESNGPRPDGPLREPRSPRPDGPLREPRSPRPDGPLRESNGPCPDGKMAAAAPIAVEPLPQDALAELMRAAKLVIANGGSTLLQAIACGSACVAVPIAKDQAERARRCIAARVAVGAALDAASIGAAARNLLDDEAARAALAGRAAALGLADGTELALGCIARLLGAPRPGGAPQAGASEQAAVPEQAAASEQADAAAQAMQDLRDDA
jgi:hypothetical protein